MLRTVTKITTEPDFKLRLTYSDEAVTVVDFAAIIRQGGVFAPLGDPDFFSKVAIGEDGRYIRWPGELDFCVDALWLEGQRESQSDMQAIRN